MDARLKRIHYEVALAAVRYSRTHSADFDDEAGSWVMIRDFPLPETHFHALERQVFIELCQTEKTVARIRHMLETGKPLRN